MQLSVAAGARARASDIPVRSLHDNVTSNAFAAVVTIGAV